VTVTIEAVRLRYPNRRLWAVFEPRSNTLRRKVFQNELIESLRAADEVVMASVFKAEGIPADERLESAAIINGLKVAKLPARELADADAIVAGVTPELKRGDVVAILSNGGFGGIYEKLPQQLRKILGEPSVEKSEVVAKS